MVVIDYIQLMRASNFKDGRVQEISEITQGLKALAKELISSSCCAYLNYLEQLKQEMIKNHN